MDFDLYNDFVDSSPQGCIFCKSWWLDAVAPGQYRVLAVYRGEEIAAAWPLVLQKKVGLSVCAMPRLTQTLGILFRPSTAKYANQLGEQKKLAGELVSQLPAYHYFNQNFSYHFTNWLPLYWQGFRQTTRYTYVIDDLHDLDAVWAGMRENIRWDIRKAERIGLTVKDDLGLDCLVRQSELTFGRQGMVLPYPVDLLKRLDEACAARGCRKMFFAVDPDGSVHAALYLVWDKKSAYYLLGGGNPELRRSGATALLVWEAIRFSSSVTRRFDFEGSMVEPVERFFRAFGARQKPYFQISRYSHPAVKLALAAGKRLF